MLLLTAFIFLGFCVHKRGLANNLSMGQEMKYVYEIYLMDYYAGTDEHSRHIGTACRRKPDGPCGFGELMKDCFPPSNPKTFDFYDKYYMPVIQSTTDATTTTPGDNEILRFQRAVRNYEADGSYNADRGRNYRALNNDLRSIDPTMPALPPNAPNMPFAKFMRTRILNFARMAMSSGKVDVALAAAAQDALSKALGVRMLDGTVNLDLKAGLDDFVGKPVSSLIVSSESGWIDWPATLKSVDTTYANDPNLATIKQKFSDWAKTIQAARGSKSIVKSHVNIMHAYQVTIDQFQLRIEDANQQKVTKIPVNHALDQQCSVEVNRVLRRRQRHLVVVGNGLEQQGARLSVF